MLAAVFRKYGPVATNLKLEEVPRPEPEADQVLVQIYAAALNDYEFGLVQGAPFIMRFFLGLLRPKLNIPGCDMAGKVIAVGDAVTRWQIGDEVYGDLSGDRFGALAEYVCCSADNLVAKPVQLGYPQAAAIPQAAVLAMQGLAAGGGLEQGQDVLINGAGGGVGYYGAQFALAKGVALTGVDSAEKAEHMRALGYSETVDYRKERFFARGKRYDLIVDTKTFHSPFAYCRALKPGGVYATVGGSLFWLMAGQLLALPLRWITGKHIKVIVLQPNAGLEYCNKLIAEGKLQSEAHHLLPFAEYLSGLQLLESGQHRGKIVLRMPVLDTVQPDV